MIDLDELERLAKAAKRCIWGDAKEWQVVAGDLVEGQFIAAISPKQMLDLISMVRQLRSEVNDFTTGYGDLNQEVVNLREDLQASKLLADANGEMFKAEKVERERLTKELADLRRGCRTWSLNLRGVVINAEHGRGFDPVYLDTIKTAEAALNHLAREHEKTPVDNTGA